MKASRVKFLEDGSEVISCCHCKFYLPRDAFNPILTRKPYVQAYCKKCRADTWKTDSRSEHRRERNRLNYQRTKKAYRLDSLCQYSKTNPPSCACCGESQYEFLAIDHINGGGNAHRREHNIGNISIWLHANNWPEGFQVLCHNCNMAKGLYGACPHTKESLCAQGS